MSSHGCCFCRKLADTDEVGDGATICSRCAGRVQALCSSRYSGGVAGGWGRLYLARDDGKIVELGRYIDWSQDPGPLLRDKCDKINRSLRKVAAGL
jgi:hypothetical protein